MAELTPSSKVYYGDTEATALHEGKKAWPYVQYAPGIFIIYNHHMYYDHPVFYDGLMPRIDLTVTIGVIRRRTAAYPGPTRRSVIVHPTRAGAVATLPTRIGRRIRRSDPTRVTRKAWLEVGATRNVRITKPTRRSAVVGSTRLKRGQ